MTALPSNSSNKSESPVVAGGVQRVGHVFLDVRQRSLHCLNEAAKELHADGVPFVPADLVGRRLLKLTGEEVKPDELPLAAACRNQELREASFVLPRPVGPAWRVAWNVAPLKDTEGQTIGVMGTVSCGPPEPDWRALAELAHDLRNPLHSIGLIHALLETQGASDAELLDAMCKIRAAADRALEVGRELLEWCRNPAHQARPVKSAWFGLETFLQKLADEHALEAGRKGLVLNVNLAPIRSWEAFTDRGRLGRLLSNLLSNAVRYTPGGRVDFSAAWRAEPAGRVLALGVVDTGAGISAEEQESIFEPFERGKAGKESDSGGSGLGLASVDNLVNDLGLELEVYSELNRGSSFHLLLPAKILRSKTA